MRDEDKTKEQLIEELEELRKQHEEQEIILDSIPAMIFYKDKEDRFVQVNKYLAEAVNIAKEELVGKTATEISPTKDYWEDDKAVMATGEPLRNIIEPLETPEGTRWLQTDKIPYRDREGNIIGIIGFAVDITERKEAEDELKEKQRLNALLLDSLPHAAMLIYKDRTVLAANQIALEVGARIGDCCWRSFGQSAFIPEQDKKYINDHNEVPPGGTRCTYCLADEALENHDPKNTEVDAWNKLWDTYWIPLDDEIYLHYAIDITERKKMQEEALKLDKLESVGVLAGGIAHDLNNLLTGVMGNISLARMYDEPSKKERRLVEAESASMRIKELTQQLLTFSRGGAPVLQTADIAGLLADSATFTLRGSNVRCDLSIPDNLWPVEIDAGQIDQVMNNLIINARQAMPNGGIVKIRGGNITIDAESGLPLEAGKYIKVSVQDEGTGIPKDHIQNIFDPFFTTKQEGNGLGLATSYSIIQKHNGHIAVESQLGVGTVFHIYLPASTEGIAIKGEEERVGPIMGVGRILVMDDEELIRELASNMLIDMGYRVTTAIDGARAIAAYKEAMELEDPYDAVIMDLTVPGGMGGEEATVRLMEIDPTAKVIVSSGYSNDPIMSNFGEYGFEGFIPKPYKVGEMSEVLHRVITKTRG